MKKSTVILLNASLILFMVVAIAACKKDKCTAGGGGELTLKLSPMHHVKSITGCTIKVKFNTQDFPGENGDYDIVTQAGVNESSVTIAGLKCGDYYIYGTGIDSSLTDADKSVKGGIPFTTKQETGTIEITVPVTEAH